MTQDQAELMWIRAHVMLNARCPDVSAWSVSDLIAAFYALPTHHVTPFLEWATRAGVTIDDAQSAPQPDAPKPENPLSADLSPEQVKAALSAQFGDAVPLYDPRTKGALQWP